MLKKFAIILLLPAMALAFAACGGGEPAETETTTESTEAISGGWEVVQETEAASLPGEVQEALDAYLENNSDDLTPMAYYGRQVTAGTDYGLLCKSNSDNELETVVLHEDPELGMTAIVNQFIIDDYTTGGGADLDAEQQEDGAWEVTSNCTGNAIPEEAQAAYAKARQSFEGTSPEPLTLLGTQVVSGTNYAFLARGRSDTDHPMTVIQVVTVYEDLEGNAEITNIYTLDIADFAE